MKQRKLRKKVTNISMNRWAAYATAGAATALVGTDQAEAEITYSGPINQVFNDPDPSATAGQVFVFNLAAGASFALLHNNRTTPTTGGFAGFAIGGAGANTAMFAGLSAGANNSYRYVARLGSNQPIGGQNFISQYVGANGAYFATMAVRGGFTNSQWLTQGIGFIAFRFDTGAGMQFGWARINMDSGPRLNSFTLIDYAYGDVGDAIATGQVPEPGSLGLLALGGVGLLAWRKRRTAVATKRA